MCVWGGGGGGVSVACDSHTHGLMQVAAQSLRHVTDEFPEDQNPLVRVAGKDVPSDVADGRVQQGTGRVAESVDD